MRNPKLMGSFQERLHETIDEFLGLDADPDDIRAVLMDDITSDLEMRKREVNGEPTPGRKTG